MKENINLQKVNKICATLGHAPLKKGDTLPYLWHWFFCTEGKRQDELGSDGHPHVSAALQGKQRMWAGGRLQFIDNLVVGHNCSKTTFVKCTQDKQGKSGPLTFVTLVHEYEQDGRIKLIEEQDIVYRLRAAPKTSSEFKAPEAESSELITCSSINEITLFRYSALTFNSHRIHYDYKYATEVEHYKDLVIHGPLVATMMLSSFTRDNQQKIDTYTYRGLFALCVGDEFIIEWSRDPGGKSARAWANKDGYVAHEGIITWE